MEELLFCKCLETDTKGQTIFQTLSDYLQDKSISLTNIAACAIDGVPAMVGRYRGFSSLLRQKNPHLFTVHCVIHRQHLVAKRLSLRLQASLSVAVNAINKIKANAKSDRLFQQLMRNSSVFYFIRRYDGYRKVNLSRGTANFIKVWWSFLVTNLILVKM